MDSLDRPQSLVQSIDTVIKSTGLAALVTYVCGYLVLTLHFSAYGFSEVNPFRPRVLTAGAYFITAIAIPGFMAFVTIRTDGVEERERRRAIILASVFFFYIACQLTGAMFLALLSGTHAYDDGLIFGILMTLWLVTARKAVAKAPHNLVTVSSALGIIFLFVRSVILMHRQDPQGAIELWFFLVGLEARWDGAHLQQAEYRRKFPLIVVLLLPLAYIFAQYFYPRIGSSWGGGRPTPIVMYLSKDSKIKPSSELQAQLVEESDAGLYVLVQGSTNAVFVPRGSIALVHFSNQPLASNLLSTDLIPASPPPPQQAEVDLCSLMRDPSAFTGHMVRLQAFVDSDLIERTLLTQDGCQGGIALNTSKAGNPPVALIEDADYRQYSKLRLKFLTLSDKQTRLQGIFEGLFIFRPNVSPAGILYLHKVSELQIKPVRTIMPDQ